LSGQVPSNCDQYAVVDFGHGPVEVRCTVIGEHTEHRCDVEFKITSNPEQANIFDEQKEETDVGHASRRGPNQSQGHRGDHRRY
jgi:hypothetical protein